MGAEPKTTAESNENSRRLDFDPQSFVNVGSWLSSQERRQTTSASTQTAAVPVPARATATTSRRVILALLALLVVLLCTNAYSYNENRAWKAERSALQDRIGKLESAAKPASMRMPSENCPGSDLVDTCWFKVGLGNCAKDALEDPIGKVEGAWRFAWDSTAEVIGAVGETIARDFYEMGDELHSVCNAALDFFGLTSGGS